MTRLVASLGLVILLFACGDGTDGAAPPDDAPALSCRPGSLDERMAEARSELVGPNGLPVFDPSSQAPAERSVICIPDDAVLTARGGGGGITGPFATAPVRSVSLGGLGDIEGRYPGGGRPVWFVTLDAEWTVNRGPMAVTAPPTYRYYTVGIDAGTGLTLLHQASPEPPRGPSPR